MSELVESRGNRSAAKLWSRRLLTGLVMLGFVSFVVWGGMNLSHGPAGPKRQVARIMILPETPPPPPPPEEHKPQPKDEPKQQVEAPKQETPPEPQPLKMEGQAGEGPSAFAAGEVKQDYIGGDIGDGSRYAAYVGRLEQRIQAELLRHKLRVDNVRLFLWLLPDGSIQRISVVGGDGDAEHSVRTALAELNRVDEAPLADMPMPVGLQISAR
jgi:protein TonB